MITQPIYLVISIGSLVAPGREETIQVPKIEEATEHYQEALRALKTAERAGSPCLYEIDQGRVRGRISRRLIKSWDPTSGEIVDNDPGGPY